MSVEKCVVPEVRDQESEAPLQIEPKSCENKSIEAEPQCIESQSSHLFASEHKMTIDDIIDVNNYPIFQRMNIEESLRKKIILCCHYYSNWIIFVTEEDEVYSFGWNRNGCLGLGDNTNRMTTPVLNETMSNKRLIDIARGLNHCIGLTRDGLLYAWGLNKKGQLGCGTMLYLNTPEVIEQIRPHKVIQVLCLYDHSMALTNDGQVFAWGHNNVGQLGVGHLIRCFLPSKLNIDEPISSISCGRFHSLALSTTGKVFVWGVNDRGQLGRHYSADQNECNINNIPLCNRPTLVRSLENVVVRKALCGDSYSLLLSEDGQVYAFGANDSGQAGCGTLFSVFEPTKIINNIKIKEIITSPRNNLSLAISQNNEFFIWGFVNTELVIRPQPISVTNERSVYDVYANHCMYKMLFKTLVVNEDHQYCIQSNLRNIDSNTSDNMSNVESSLNDQMNVGFDKDDLYNLKDHLVNLISYYHQIHNSFKDIKSFQRLIESKASKILSTESSTVSHQSLVSKAMKNRLKTSFNNPEHSDLKFVSDNKIIYCQKNFLKFRNKKFWKKIKQNIDENKEIRITSERFEECFEFLKFLHGIEPELNDIIVFRMQTMAEIFGEKELLDHCSNYINLTVCVDNVCALYQKSITINSFDLEKSCIEFTAKNLEAVIKTEAFKKLNHLTKTRLITTVSNFKKT